MKDVGPGYRIGKTEFVICRWYGSYSRKWGQPLTNAIWAKVTAQKVGENRASSHQKEEEEVYENNKTIVCGHLIFRCLV